MLDSGLKNAQKFFFDLLVEQCIEWASSRFGQSREGLPWVESELDSDFKQSSS